jgi:hypothetical protein
VGEGVEDSRRGGGRGRRGGNRGRGRRGEGGGDAEHQSQEGGGVSVERRPWMRELVKERVIGSVGLKGKGAAKDMFKNCLEASCGDLVD